MELLGISVITGKNVSHSWMCVLLCTMIGVAHFYPVNRGRCASWTWSGKGPGGEATVCVFDRVSLSENKKADSSQWQVFPKHIYCLWHSIGWWCPEYLKTTLYLAEATWETRSNGSHREVFLQLLTLFRTPFVEKVTWHSYSTQLEPTGPNTM